MSQKAQRGKIPISQLTVYLRRYQADFQADVSTKKAHVYYSGPMQKWITVIREGDQAILTFTTDCPCARVLDGKTPW